MAVLPPGFGKFPNQPQVGKILQAPQGVGIAVFRLDYDAGQGGNDDFDIGDLSDKIMSNTARESGERDYRNELEGMGPAPVLPEFNPDKLRRMDDRMDEENEDSHIYRPVTF